MQVQSVELIHLDVPFTDHTNQHMQYWLPHWRIVQLCKITLADGTIGWGETIPNYTWAKVPEDIEDRIVGRAVGDLLWEDALGAGVQQALFDAVGKVLGAPVYRLLGTKVRTWCPLSWWASPVGHQGPHVVSAVVVGDGHAGRRLGAPVRRRRRARLFHRQAQGANLVRPARLHPSHY